MNPKYQYAALMLAATALAGLAGCAAPAPAETPEQTEARCEATAIAVAVGQTAKNNRMPQDEFDSHLAALAADPQFTPTESALIKTYVRKGYNSLEGVDPRIMAQKAYDDCTDGK